MRDGPMIATDESTIEVFAHIGITFFAAQSFEACLNGLITGLYVTENPENWRENYEKEMRGLDALTLGGLLTKARKSVSFSDEVEETLKLAQKRRNHFIHRDVLPEISPILNVTVSSK